MSLFRSSLFTVRVGNTDVGIGPSSVLKVVLDAADRAVDRKRAAVRDEVIARLMANVSFDKAYQALPAHCFALMQSLPQTDQVAFGQQIKLIQAAQLAPRVKSLLLGLALLNLVGEDVLRSAVNSLGGDIQ